MFAVGHIALGYLLGKITAKFTRTEIKIPILFALAILPDVDLLIPGITHRGPTHSIIVMALLFLPFLIFYGKTVTPYIMATVQHIGIGDYLTGEGVQLLWPLNRRFYGLKIDPTIFVISIISEWIFFTVSLIVLLQTKDIHKIIKPHTLNLTFILPIIAIILPSFLGFPTKVPRELLVPHLIYLIVFSTSILKDVEKTLKK